jgi:ribosome-associated toxin RatA of RatAB toxin-antitoxin module
MGTKFTALLLLSIFIVLLADNKTDSNLETTEWKQIKNRKDIFISSRWTNLDNKVQIKEIKTETCINVSKDNLLNYIKTGIYSSEWMPMVKNNYTYLSKTKNEWNSELTLSLTRPLSNNKIEISYSLKDDSNYTSLIVFNCENAIIHGKKINPKYYQYTGSWEFISLNENTTKAILKIEWNRNNSLHYWIASPIIKESTFSSVKNLKQKSEEKYKTDGLAMTATAL